MLLGTDEGANYQMLNNLCYKMEGCSFYVISKVKKKHPKKTMWYV